MQKFSLRINLNTTADFGVQSLVANVLYTPLDKVPVQSLATFHIYLGQQLNATPFARSAASLAVQVTCVEGRRTPHLWQEVIGKLLKTGKPLLSAKD